MSEGKNYGNDTRYVTANAKTAKQKREYCEGEERYETEKTPDEELNGFLKMGCHETMSDIFEVNRGGMTGKGVFYRDNSWSYEHYEERTRYPENEDGQNAFELYIEHEVQEESDRNKVREIMDDPKIKALIDSIRYEPDVCKKIINGK